MYLNKEHLISRITVPDNYEVSHLPSPKSYSNSLIEMDYKSILNSDSTLSVTLNYYFKKSEYQPKDYSRIKAYFEELIKKSNEKIVLKKI